MWSYEGGDNLSHRDLYNPLSLLFMGDRKVHQLAITKAMLTV